MPSVMSKAPFHSPPPQSPLGTLAAAMSSLTAPPARDLLPHPDSSRTAARLTAKSFRSIMILPFFLCSY